MKSKNLAALGILLTLVGCGGGDSDSKPSGDNGGNEGGNGGEPTPPATNLITSWPMSKVIAEIAATNVTQTVDSNVCSNDNNHKKPTVETANFIVSTMNGTQDDVIKAAKITQASFNELLVHTKLTPAELNLSANSKWTACFSNKNIGTDNSQGTGYPDRFDFAPSTLDVTHPDFTDTSILTKHELFHTIQAELLGDSEPYDHLPRWFQEGSAELFAGRHIRITSHKHDEFAIDADRTPLSIETYNDELAVMSEPLIKAAYEDHMYNLYHDNVNYLVAQGLSVKDTLTLIRDSSGQQFDTAIGAVEQKLNLPTPYIELRDDVNSYRNNVIDTLHKQEITAAYIDDIQANVSQIIITSKGKEDTVATGSVNRAQNQYAINGRIADGNYDAYASVKLGENDDIMYGPIDVTVKNNVLGSLDFTGAPALAD
ncbi:hypothetical protein [Vibrio renipiscarius]|uniref:Lipoprotein n=1 Tax=Vibrio renipiscarius TaxID=1461322 RepID=A0A0C2JQ13_9VIBR|nr:hypothetical protein [Vibrio renipiscarius]KII79886.1 hypothetical protein OJ16_07730 [Vibrio renipiscarius]KII80139.1 hypothetical protein PL18_06005 [Vibrio renipiscarius]